MNHQQLPTMEKNGVLPTYKQEVAGSSPALPTNILCDQYTRRLTLPDAYTRDC